MADGLWIALGGWVAALVGGLLAAADGGAGSAARGRREDAPAPASTAFPRLEPERPPVFAPSVSVPPPGGGAEAA